MNIPFRKRLVAFVGVWLLVPLAAARMTESSGAGLIPDPTPVTSTVHVADTVQGSLVPCDGSERACVSERPSADDIAGVWRMYFRHPIIQPPGGMAYMRLTADGRFIIAETPEATTEPSAPYPHGTFTLEDGVITFMQGGEIVIEACATGSYLVSLLYYGANRVALAHSLVEDACPGRPQDSAVPMVWHAD